MDLRQHVTPIRGQRIDGAAGNVRRPWRVLTMAAVIVAAVLLGAAVGRALPTKPETGPTAQNTPSASETAESFEYFPSRYANQATEAEEHIQAF